MGRATIDGQPPCLFGTPSAERVPVSGHLSGVASEKYRDFPQSAFHFVPTQHCKPMQRMWRHHGHDSAVQPGRPSLHHPSSHHQGLRLRAVMPGGQRAGNDCSKCAHMSTITRLRLDAALHEPAASRDPGQRGRLRRKGVTPALTQKHPQPPAFSSSARPQPPAHHVEVIALKTTRSQAGDDLHLVDLQCDSLIP